MSKFNFVIVGLLVAVLILSGCTQTPPAANTGDNTTPPANTGDNTTPPAGGTNPGFLNLYGLGTEYKGTYTMALTPAQTGSGGELTWYHKGTRQRMDMATGGMQIRTFVSPDKIVLCSGATTAEEQCFEATSFSQTTVDAEDMRQNPTAYQTESLPNRTIAGQVGNCYRITYQGAQSEYCLTTDGMLLYVKSTAEGQTTEMTATSVTRGVTDAEVTAPQATPMGGGTNGLPPGFDPNQYT